MRTRSLAVEDGIELARAIERGDVVIAAQMLLAHEKLRARQAVRRSEGHHRLVLGTPEEVAGAIIDLWADGTVDGYTLQPPRAPDDIEEFVDKVIPILQERGVYRTAYEGKTIRDRYGLPYPFRDRKNAAVLR